MSARSIARVYVENEVADHPRTLSVLERLPKAEVVRCERYGEIFNRKAQNFRLQKLRPSLILARKHQGHVLPAPPGYGVGGSRNFYFSHMYNCIYDCRYCFLQGMYRSANYVLFVNYEDTFDTIDRILDQNRDHEVWFFSGYDCDSLALESLTGFARDFLPAFAQRPKAWLELRTKSVNTRSLLEFGRTRGALANCVVAFSFTPEWSHSALEVGVPSVLERVRAADELARQGWRLGLRFDPLLWSENYRDQYRELFDTVLEGVPAESVHSISFGSFRLPTDFHRRMKRLHADQRLFAVALETEEGMVGYPKQLEHEMASFVRAQLDGRVSSEILFPCGMPVGPASGQGSSAA